MLIEQFMKKYYLIKILRKKITLCPLGLKGKFYNGSTLMNNYPQYLRLSREETRVISNPLA